MASLTACEEAWEKVNRLKVTVSAVPLKEFFPRQELYNYLSREKIERILSCECNTCRTDRSYFKVGPTNQFFNKIEFGEGDDGPSKMLLSLLIYIGHPSLIRNILVDGGLCDSAFWKRLNGPLSTPITQDDLMKGYWKEMTNKAKVKSMQTARSFIEQMHKFASPIFSSVTFEKFSPSTILPFVNERPLRSSDGPGIPIIYHFDIHPDHRSKKSGALTGGSDASNFEFACGIKSFVRKEINPVSNLEIWWEEKKNIDLAARANNPHIIKTCKTYRQNGKFNLVFPFYKNGDLERYLARSNPHTLIETDPAWREFVNIVGAIEALGKTQPDQSRDQSANHGLVPPHTEPIMLGFHFDLKPGNVLVDDNDRWIVSDFGQAYFNRENGNSSVTHHGGTDAYAPPELSKLERRYLDRYDVFSLGCILLELIAYIAGGPTKRAEFLECRKFSTSNGVVSRVSVLNADTEKYELRNEIINFMNHTVDPGSLSTSTQGAAILNEFLSMAFKMVTPDVTQRPGISFAKTELEKIITKFKEKTTPVPPKMPDTQLSGRSYYYFNDADDDDPLAWDEAQLAVTYPEKDWVNIRFWWRTRGVSRLKFKRSRYIFVPLHGFGIGVGSHLQKDGSRNNLGSNLQKRAQFYLSDLDTNLPTLKNSEFFSVSHIEKPKGVWTAAYAAQSSLTGQEVLRSRRISGFAWDRTRHGPFRRKVEKLLEASSSAGSVGNTHELTDINPSLAATAEIWKEGIPEGLDEDPPPVHAYRLAVFVGQCIVLFKFHPEWDLEMNPPPKTVLRFKPTDSTHSNKFRGSVLLPPAPDSTPKTRSHAPAGGSTSSTSSISPSPAAFAGIPFTRRGLEVAEKEGTFDAKSFELEFADEIAAKKFQKTFDYAKKESRKERHPPG